MLPPRTAYEETEPGLFTRQCVGSEAFACRRSEDDSFAHTFASCRIKFHDDITPSALKQKVLDSFIRLRYLVPSIACTSTMSSSGFFHFNYRVPQSYEDALKWCDEVVFVRETEAPFEENHARIVAERWWKASAGRGTYELHVAPNEDKATWTFSVSAHHGNADARGVCMIFDKFLEYLVDEINSDASPAPSLVWGEEICRLSPAGPAVWPTDDPQLPGQFPSGPKFPPRFPSGDADNVPWSYQVRPHETSTPNADVTVAVKLSQEQTAQFRSVCRAHGRTVTQVVTALFALTDLESALINAGKVGLERFQELHSSFDKSTHFVSMFNSVSMRSRMPEAYQKFGSDRSTPLMSADGFQLVFPFAPFRKLLSLDDADLSVKRKVDMPVFWEEIVSNVADAWKTKDMSPEAYQQRAALIDSLVAFFNRANFTDNVSPSTSSFGDLTQLGYLKSFLPSSGNKTLTVEDVDWSVRSNLPNCIAGFYQYDGQFRVTVTKGAQYTTQEEMNAEGKVLEDWLQAIIAS